MLGIAEMVIHLAVHTALDHPLAQLAQQPALTGQSAEEDAVAQESESTSARVKM